MSYRKNWADEVEALQNYQVEAEKKFAHYEKKIRKLEKKLAEVVGFLNNCWHEDQDGPKL